MQIMEGDIMYHQILLLSGLMMMTLCIHATAGAEEIAFPDDPRAMINVKTEFGAVGDGVADDTAALQRAIEVSQDGPYTRFVYLPKGTYRITEQLVFRHSGLRADQTEGWAVGPWLFGQSRDETIIRLDDGAEGFQNPDQPRAAIRAMSRPDGAGMNADFFDRMIVNLTVDTGDNAGAIGIRFYSNNTGEMRHVVIRGNGAIGLDLGFVDQNGPLLIQDVEIEGFATGISTDHLLNMQTLSRVTVRRARTVGLRHRGQSMAVEALHVDGAPMAIDSAGGVLTIIDSQFQASDGADGPAIQLADGHLYAARLQTAGYARAIASDAPAGHVEDADVDEYISHPAITLGDASPAHGLLMTPEPEPDLPFPAAAEQWVCVDDFGARSGNDDDDTQAFQDAIDHAASIGASTVYFLGGKRGDPNWYLMSGDVRVHGSVERLIGFGFARIINANDDPNNPPRFVIEDEPDGPQVLTLQYLHVFGAAGFGVDIRSANRTVILRGMDGRTTVGPGATVFVSNAVGRLHQQPGSTAWLRHWNTEGRSLGTDNRGGQQWILGLKTEAVSTKVTAIDGGRTEVLGVHNYNYTGTSDDTPFFRVDNGAMSIAGYREATFTGQWWRQTGIASFNDEQHHLGQQQWHTWSLLRAGE